MKTDLSKVLAVSGQSGLYLYISSTRTGAVVEALAANTTQYTHKYSQPARGSARTPRAR